MNKEYLRNKISKKYKNANSLKIINANRSYDSSVYEKLNEEQNLLKSNSSSKFKKENSNES